MNERSRLKGWHPETEFRNLLAQVKDLISKPNFERNMLMALSKEVQDLVDQVRSLKDVVQSVDTGFKALKAQNDEQAAKIAALPVAPASLSQEDKDALVQSTQDTTSLINTLQSDIPANTPAAAPADQAQPAQ